MKKYCLLILFILLPLSACKKSSESINNPDLSEKILLSKIIVDGNLFKEFFYNPEGKIIQINQFYNGNVSLTENYYYNSKGQFEKRERGDYIDSFEYKQNGFLKSYTTYYEKTQKIWKEEYEYETTNLIQKGTTYYNYEKRGYIEYEYDFKKNTIVRKEYENEDNFLISELKIQYDNYKNPLPISYPIDLILNNNVIKFYNYLAVMSSPPEEYESEYEYDADGNPIKEERRYTNGDNSIIEYVYSTH